VPVLVIGGLLLLPVLLIVIGFDQIRLKPDPTEGG
jgi:hypothetical protein